MTTWTLNLIIFNSSENIISKEIIEMIKIIEILHYISTNDEYNNIRNVVQNISGMYVYLILVFFSILWTKPRSCHQKNDFQKPAPDFFENIFENIFEI